MSSAFPNSILNEVPPDARFGVIAARFNQAIVDELLAGCVRRFEALGIGQTRLIIERVPGAFELPVAAKAMGRGGSVSAIVCLGAVVRGDTPHFDYVAGECARGIAQVGIELCLPVIFGVLTTNTQQQALDRIGGSHGHAGERAAEAALEMAALMSRLSDSGRRGSV